MQQGLDIVVAWNANECEGGGNRIEYYVNPGPATARQSNAWASLPIDRDAPPVKWVGAADIDRDGDLDIVATYPMARGQNLRWYRNPRVDIADVFHISDGTWQRGSIGNLATGSDVFDIGDIDNDGILDVAVRSTNGLVLSWFKGLENPTTDPVRNLPWPVFTIAEFNSRVPQAIHLADIDGDGQLEVLASAQGAVIVFDVFEGSTVFDQWSENLLLDDQGVATPTVTDPNVDPGEVSATGTIINEITTVDIDGDGRLDIVTTLDRRDQSGITNDAIIWFRNNR
jgi:VCBS repeat protein